MNAGVIIVDHGSRAAESNELLHELVRRFADAFAAKYPIVEPAHMELAEPTIAQAFARCVERGAQVIVVCPYFLSPGKHWQSDIPRLVAAAAEKFPDVSWRITDTLGIDELMLRLLDKRIAAWFPSSGSIGKALQI